MKRFLLWLINTLQELVGEAPAIAHEAEKAAPALARSASLREILNGLATLSNLLPAIRHVAVGEGKNFGDDADLVAKIAAAVAEKLPAAVTAEHVAEAISFACRFSIFTGPGDKPPQSSLPAPGQIPFI